MCTQFRFQEFCSILRCSCSISYSRQISLAGLLYFHRISDIRMSGSPLRNLGYFQQLCDNELDRVILTTTMWDEVDEETGTNREKVLQADFWKPLIDRGSSVKRFLNDSTSAFDILRPIVRGTSTHINAKEFPPQHGMAGRWRSSFLDKLQRATEIATNPRCAKIAFPLSESLTTTRRFRLVLIGNVGSLFRIVVLSTHFF